MVICDDCQPEAAGPVAETPTPEPEQVPSHHTERAEGQVFLHDVHSPKTPEGEHFSFIMDSNRSPEEIVAFAAGVDYGVRKHLDLFIEVLRKTMDMHEHREATALLACLEDSKQRQRDEAAKVMRQETPRHDV
jgi:hypothetical protein